MTDRISSDHPSVETIRATVTETATGVRLDIPADDEAQFPTGEVVRIVLEESERFGILERAMTDDRLLLRGVYESPNHARDPRNGTDRFEAWVDDVGIRTGGSVLVDVIEPSFLYGLRKPGETTVYDAHEPPSGSLSEIAKTLEES